MKCRKITQEKQLAFDFYLVESEKSRATREKYARDLARFADFAAGETLDKALLVRYKAYLAGRYAVSSANSMLAAVNSFLRFCGWDELCVKQFKIQKSAYCPEEKELRREEYQALVGTARRKKDERLALVLQTLCGTGIRVGELHCITVEAARKGEALVSSKGKSRKVFLVSALQKRLLRYAAKKNIHAGPIFITNGGKPLCRSNIWRAMKRLCSEAGVAASKVFPHNLRHLFARTFYRMEKDIAKLADILGHTNINTTRIYTISTGEEHRRRMERLRLVQ